MKIAITNIYDKIVFESKNISTSKILIDTLVEKSTLLYDKNNSVFVCFVSWNKNILYDDNIYDIFVSKMIESVWDYAHLEIKRISKEIDCKLQIHQFESFQDAFDFCKLLKEEC